ncbi:MAG: hypothetical protein ACLTE2_04400 [Eubacteriales bacterium]
MEVKTETLTVLGKAPSSLPFEVDQFPQETKEDVRLKYRFWIRETPKVHNNIVLRSQVLSFLRSKRNESNWAFGYSINQFFLPLLS